MILLRTWQTERLSHTYSDLLESRRYRQACRFFLDDIYAPKDFTQRDHDIERMYNFMRRFIPERIIHSLTLAVELNTLTHQLDDALLDALTQLGMTDTLTADEQARLYAAIRRVLRQAIQERGTTLDDRGYVDAQGETGGYQARLAVYDRRREPCPVCRTPIERIVVGGRSTHFCPQCQH